MTCKLLIVDDNEINIEIIEKAIKKTDQLTAEIKSALNGKEALETLNDWTPDIILLDIRMPIMDGMEFLEKFRSLNGRYKEVKIIVISSYSSIEAQDRAIKLGAETFLDKVNVPSILIQTIKENLNKKYNSYYNR